MKLKRSYAVRMLHDRLPHLSPTTIADRLSYGSFVSLPHKILYVETPKAACTTIKEFLRELCGAPPIAYTLGPLHETRRDMFIHVRSNVPLPSLTDLDDETQRSVLTDPDFLRFCIVRNPYARITSAWRNKVLLCEPGYELIYRKLMGSIPPIRGKKTLLFEQFLRFVESEEDLSVCNPHWRRQTDLLLLPAMPYTHIGKIERFAETQRLIEAHINATAPLKFRNSNSTSSGRVRGYVDEAMARRIYRLYADDFATLGYPEDSWRDLYDVNAESVSSSDAQYVDDIIERNMIIALLYERYETCYRLSFDRLRDMFQTLRRKLSQG